MITPHEQLTLLNNYLLPPIENEVSLSLSLILPLAHLVAEYAVVAWPMLTHWHTVLEKLHLLPDLVPPLPKNIIQILSSECPLSQNKKKEDNSCYRIYETHMLYLLPQDTNPSIIQRIRDYGKKHFLPPIGRHSLQFRSYITGGTIPINFNIGQHQQWILISKTPLAGSQNKSFEEQNLMIAELNQSSFAKEFNTHYTVPRLIEISVAIFFHKIATDIPINSQNKEPDGIEWTRVKEKTVGKKSHITVGRHTDCGLSIGLDVDLNNKKAPSTLGMSVIWKLPVDKLLEEDHLEHRSLAIKDTP